MAQPVDTNSTTLQLDRRLQNYGFESWKIGSSFVSVRTCIELPDSVYQGAADAVDFAHTRAALMCNHLFSSQGRLFAVTAAAGGAIRVNEVSVEPRGQQVGPVLRPVADIPAAAAAAGDAAVVAPTDATLHASLAVLAAPQQAAAAAAAGGGDKAGYQVLVSSGKGDLVLLTVNPGQPGVVSAPVYPLRPPAPALGAKPFSIAAAWINTAGVTRAVLSCLTDTTAAAAAAAAAGGGGSSSRGGAGHKSSWVCETWLVTLSVQEQLSAAAAAAAEGGDQAQQQQQQQQQQRLQVLDCQLLLVAQVPPAAAVADAAADQVMLVSEPRLEKGELPTGYRQQLAAAQGLSQQSPAADTPMDTDPLAAAAAAGAAAAGLRNQAAGGSNDDVMAGGDDEEGDDMDPRTLAAAAARLAKYTSEMEVGDLPQQQWSDVFKETGPGELGAGGSEPAVDVLLYGPATSSTTTSSNSSSSSMAPATQPLPCTPSAAAAAAVGKFTLKCTGSCGPHKLLAADSCSVMQPAQMGQVPDAAGPGAGSGPGSGGLLLGLTDDVDCAVVTAAFGTPAAAAAAGAAAAGSSSSSGGSGVVLSHTAILPAIAYVVAGKTQRRHLLLAPDASTSPMCCALVEGSKYSYLYGNVAQGSTHGQQQIVDMELPAGQSILGARLVQLSSSSSSRRDASAAAGGGTVLLLLTQSQLVCYQLRAPA